LKGRNNLRGFFSNRKADDAGGLTPGKENNAAVWKKDRKVIVRLIGHWCEW